MLNYRRCVVMGVFVLGLVASGPSVRAQEDPAQKYAGKPPDATVDIDEIQIGYLVMGTLGGGTLHYQGQDYRFKIGGLGAGGAGADKLKASGEVYGLEESCGLRGGIPRCAGGHCGHSERQGGFVVEEQHGDQYALEDAA